MVRVNNSSDEYLLSEGKMRVSHSLAIALLAILFVVGGVVTAVSPIAIAYEDDSTNSETAMYLTADSDKHTAIVADSAQIDAESAVNAQGLEKRLKKIARKRLRAIKTMSKREIRNLPARDTIRLKRKQSANGLAATAQPQYIDCRVGPDDPHPSSTTGGETVNVHHYVQCPVAGVSATLVLALIRDDKFMNAASGEFVAIPYNNKRSINTNAPCIAGVGGHNYLAGGSTTLLLPGYTQTTGYYSAREKYLEDC